MNRYLYKGPVMEFKRCIQSDWTGETMAISEKKALSNLTWQWKKAHNRVGNCKIELPGRLYLID